MNSIFIVSLDYEMFWGMQDTVALRQYKDHISGTYEAVLKLLSLFDRYGIHSTWATVGMMHAGSMKELKKYMPDKRPSYKDRKYSSYRCLKCIEKVQGAYDKYFFAPGMIEEIRAHEGTEIGTHTFSHYYCAKEGQTVGQFEADLISDRRIRGEESSVSLVFPRNYAETEYVSVLKKHGIYAYRGLEDNWINKVRPEALQRVLRLADSYLPLTHTNEYFPGYEEGVINLRGSRFFRPYNKKLFFLEGLKVKRIKGQMLKAAKNHRVFHLWWHPHNIGTDQEKNLHQLETVFKYYALLHKQYGMKSLNMKEAAAYYRC